MVVGVHGLSQVPVVPHVETKVRRGGQGPAPTKLRKVPMDLIALDQTIMTSHVIENHAQVYSYFNFTLK